MIPIVQSSVVVIIIATIETTFRITTTVVL